MRLRAAKAALALKRVTISDSDPFKGVLFVWTLVRIKSTGQVVEMAPGVAQALIESGLAEIVVEKKSLIAKGRELAANFCRGAF